jgi:hypothetical protein
MNATQWLGSKPVNYIIQLNFLNVLNQSLIGVTDSETSTSDYS